MKRPLLVLAAASFASACAGGANPSATPAPHRASAGCPLRTPGDWQGFLASWAEQPSWVVTCGDASNCDQLVGAFSAQVQQQMLGSLAQCSPDLADNPPIARCMDRLQRFSAAWLAQHDQHSYGFAVSTSDYLAAQTSKDMPSGMMDPPLELLAAWPDRAAIEAVARDHGWPYLEHESCLGGVRLFFNITDRRGRFDQWLLVGFDPTAATLPSGAILSFLAIQKRAGDGSPLPQLRVHFRDYVLASGNGGVQLELPDGSGGKCFSCHPSGPRQLVPFAGNVLVSEPVLGEPDYGAAVDATFGQKRLADFQTRLASYGLPAWNGTLVPNDHGPRLGANLGCTDCHNDETRGALSVFTSEGALYQKMVEQLSMRGHRLGQLVPDQAAMDLLERERTGTPPLTTDEVAALQRSRDEHAGDYQALVQSRLPALEAWLLGQPCQ